MPVSRNVILWDVDTQRDFMLPGGALYVPGAEKTIPNLQRLVDAARQGRVFLVSDICTHTPDDPEFKVWPPHCVAGTPGAEKIPESVTGKAFRIPNEPGFRVPAGVEKQYPQIVLEKQTLDVFDNPHAKEMVARLGRQPEYLVFGVVTEYCVRLAAKGLLDQGCRVALITDAIATLKEEDGRRAIEELTARGARLVTTDEALAQLQVAGCRS